MTVKAVAFVSKSGSGRPEGRVDGGSSLVGGSSGVDGESAKVLTVPGDS
jgi:hypothetical protein